MICRDCGANINNKNFCMDRDCMYFDTYDFATSSSCCSLPEKDEEIGVDEDKIVSYEEFHGIK